jgi:hypothetical protein
VRVATNSRFAIGLTLLIITATVVSLVEGSPDRLPGVALGSPVLLHVERAAAVFAIVVAIVSVLRKRRADGCPPS